MMRAGDYRIAESRCGSSGAYYTMGEVITRYKWSVLRQRADGPRRGGVCSVAPPSSGNEHYTIREGILCDREWDYTMPEWRCGFWWAHKHTPIWQVACFLGAHGRAGRAQKNARRLAGPAFRSSRPTPAVGVGRIGQASSRVLLDASSEVRFIASNSARTSCADGHFAGGHFAGLRPCCAHVSLPHARRSVVRIDTAHLPTRAAEVRRPRVQLGRVLCTVVWHGRGCIRPYFHATFP
jgi:hypothetical protein